MKKLIVISVVVLLGMLVDSALAVGPPKHDSDQELISVPLPGKSLDCSYVNVSERTITVDHFAIFNPVGLQGQSNATIDSLESSGFGIGGLVTERAITCVLRWFGRANEIRASWCSYSDDQWTQGTGCVALERSK
jgi:hypothetical protein